MWAKRLHLKTPRSADDPKQAFNFAIVAYVKIKLPYFLFHLVFRTSPEALRTG